MLHPSDDMAVRTWIASLDEEGILPKFMRVYDNEEEEE